MHRGQILKKILNHDDVSTKKLAKDLGVSRSSLYRFFNDPNLNYRIIADIGLIIHHDFFNDFPDMILDDNSIIYQIKSKKELQVEVEYWKDKYITLLEQHNKIIEQKVEL